MDEERKTVSSLGKVSIGNSVITVSRTYGNKELGEIFAEYIVGKAFKEMEKSGKAE